MTLCIAFLAFFCVLFLELMSFTTSCYGEFILSVVSVKCDFFRSFVYVFVVLVRFGVCLVGFECFQRLCQWYGCVWSIFGGAGRQRCVF